MTEPVEAIVTENSCALPNAMREVRLLVPDSRDPKVRARVAEEVRRLNPEDEAETMRWIEAVTRLDEAR